MHHPFKPRTALALGILASTLAAAAVTLGASPASAQSSMPNSTVSTYEDWTVRCRASEPAAGERTGNICEMVTFIRVQTPESTDANGKPVPAQVQVLAQIALGHLPETKDLKAVVQVPSGIWLRDPLVIRFGETSEALDTAGDDHKLTMFYFRCAANYCLADSDLDATKLAAFRAAKNARLSFTDGARRTVNVPISMKGFSSALDGMGGS